MKSGSSSTFRKPFSKAKSTWGAYLFSSSPVQASISETQTSSTSTGDSDLLGQLLFEDTPSPKRDQKGKWLDKLGTFIDTLTVGLRPKSRALVNLDSSDLEPTLDIPISELSCYQNFKSIDIQRSLDSLHLALDTDLLTKTTRRCSYQNRNEVLVQPETIDSQLPLQEEQKPFSSPTKDYASEIYLNLEINKLFEKIKTTNDSEITRFYNPSNDRGITFPNFQVSAKLTDELLEEERTWINSLDEEATRESEFSNDLATHSIVNGNDITCNTTGFSMNNSTKLVEWPSTDDIDINTNNNILDTFVSRPFNSPTLETIDGGFKENEYENITIQKSSKALELRESNRKFDSPIPQQNDDSLKLRVQQSQSQIESQPQPQLLSVTTPQLVDTTNDELNTGTLRFNSKAKVLVYDSESDCKSIRKTFDSENNSRICSNSLRMINRSINKRLSSFSSAMAVRSPTIMNNNNNTKDNSILKSKVNLNREQESIRAYNCDEVDVEDFMCFFETYERRRMDTEPFLGHFRVKQVESYYENIQNRFIE